MAKPVREAIDKLSRNFLFVPALWVALMTVLLCAILPAGLPLTKTIGSAFSPSTTAVALKGSSEQLRGAMKRVVKGDPAPVPDLTQPPAHPLFVTPGIPAVPQRPPAQKASPPLPRDPTPALPDGAAGLPYPRGPPIA
jgi:hypothetical protein